MLAQLIVYAMNYLRQFENEEGQGMVEYGLILVLISIVAILMMTNVGDAVLAAFTSVEAGLTQ